MIDVQRRARVDRIILRDGGASRRRHPRASSALCARAASSCCKLFTGGGAAPRPRGPGVYMTRAATCMARRRPRAVYGAGTAVQQSGVGSL